ncbi:MAG: P-loop NTPase [bacterium]|nr:P-loop NTPase [bacterium]
MNTAKKRIWAIAGGKGGVGKSFLSTNLSIDLAQKGNEVALIDADFGGANLHTFFGVGHSKVSISDFIKSNQLSIEDIMIPTGVQGLKLASGAHDVIGMASPKQMQQAKLIKSIYNMRVDYVVIDLGAGIAPHTLDLFLMSNSGILVTAPEPTSVENTYRFIKSAFYRKLKNVMVHSGVRAFLEQITESKHEDNPRTPAELINKISGINAQAGETLKYEIAAFKPKLVLNQVRTPSDVRVGFSMKQACLKYFGINLDYVGFVEFDNMALQSIRARQPVILHAPDSVVSASVRRVAHNIRQNYHLVPTA